MESLFSGFWHLFFLLCSYYILRPIRDSMAISGGVDNIQWLFTATFFCILLVVPIYGWACSRLRRVTLLVSFYATVIGVLLVFAYLFTLQPDHLWLARIFYVWLSVFNLLMISIFWSLITDLFKPEQAHRVFGFIAAGGSLGALTGPLISAILVNYVGHSILFVIAATGFLFVILLVLWLIRQTPCNKENESHHLPISGNPFAGFFLVLTPRYLLVYSLFIMLVSAVSTFLYFQQAELVSQHLPDANSRTQLFAYIDLAVNALSLLSQVALTGNIVKRFGVTFLLTIVPVALLLGFISFAIYPVLSVVIAIIIIRRVGTYAFVRPCREMLFTSLSREVKYKAKSFIDTVVYRGGDATSSWFYTACVEFGFNQPGTAIVASVLASGAAFTGYYLGKNHQQN